MDIKLPSELLDYMDKNIQYGYLGKNDKLYKYDDINFDADWYDFYILQSPKQLLTNKYGNCFDQVELERFWFLENNYEVKTFFEIVNLDYENIYPTHSFLIYKENDKWNLFENADSDNKGIYTFSNIEQLLDFQLNNYIKTLKKYNIKDEEIEKIVLKEFNNVKYNISASEYIESVLNENK